VLAAVLSLAVLACVAIGALSMALRRQGQTHARTVERLETRNQQLLDRCIYLAEPVRFEPFSDRPLVPTSDGEGLKRERYWLHGPAE
jgi:hypothetical protein